MYVDGDFFVHYVYKISYLPASITELSELRILSLNDHVIASLPEDFGKLTKLEKLNLRDNLLEGLPQTFAQLKNLEQLNLKANEIGGLPMGFDKLTSMKKLNLAFNKRLDARLLVGMLGKMNNLEWLDVSFNDINASNQKELQSALPNCTIQNMQFTKPGEGF